MNYSKLNPSDIKESKVVIKFSTPECGPCRMLSPKFDSLSKSEEFKDSGITFLTVNPQENTDWLVELGIRSVPTTVGFVEGKSVFKVVGNKIEDIKSNIEKSLINTK